MDRQIYMDGFFLWNGLSQLKNRNLLWLVLIAKCFEIPWKIRGKIMPRPVRNGKKYSSITRATLLEYIQLRSQHRSCWWPSSVRCQNCWSHSVDHIRVAYITKTCILKVEFILVDNYAIRFIRNCITKNGILFLKTQLGPCDVVSNRRTHVVNCGNLSSNHWFLLIDHAMDFQFKNFKLKFHQIIWNRFRTCSHEYVKYVHTN